MSDTFEWSEHWHDIFSEICSSRWGFRYPPEDAFTLRNVVERAFQASAAEDLEAFSDRLATLPDADPEVQAFIGMMVVGETSFFRNRPQFDAISQRIVPELIDSRLADRTRRLRIWSAGCSSGEEPYSVAIMLAEAIPDWAQWDIKIFGTDISPFALRRARGALYTDWSFREADPAIVRKYFARVGKLQRLDHPCRGLVTFFRQNLITGPIPDASRGLAELDLLFCRNVTIYFGRTKTARLAEQFFDALHPGGWLVVGHTEPDAAIYSRFEAVDFPDTILYRRPIADAPSPHHEIDLASDVTPDAATEYTDRAVPQGPLDHPTVGEPALADALAAYESADLASAYELLVVACQRASVDPLPPHLLAQLSADEKRYDEALYWAFTALQRDSFHVPTLLLMGLVCLEIGDPSRAKEQFQQALFVDPMCPEAHLYLSMAHRALGHDDQAERSRERASRLARETPPPAAPLLPVQRARLHMGNGGPGAGGRGPAAG